MGNDMRVTTRVRRAATSLLAGAIAVTVAASVLSGAGRKFYDDDPIAREPETQDASGAAPWEIDLIYDLTYNLFATPRMHTAGARAGNINTIDEVPDSSWFTNRILARDVTAEEIARGPLTGDGPAPGTWTVVRAKEAGAAPGFTMEDTAGDTWFVSFDSKGFPEAATGAILVANKLFWAIGYWQAENHLITVRPEALVIGETAKWDPPSARRRQMRRGDLESVLSRAHRSPDGSYRAVAARALPGKVLGGFRYVGTRPDDPNDLVPHEDRRELRALRVFGAWTNLVDMKAGNTLDSIVTENGKGIVRHYLQDVGSTFGSGANGPHDYDEGWEFLYEGDKIWKRALTMGLVPREPWQSKAKYQEFDSIGRFEGDAFVPSGWRPRVPTAAFLRARPDDDFWAARRVMAFTDEQIRAAVKTGQFSDPAAEKYLGDVLIKRRDKIGGEYFLAINPLVDFAFDGSALTFENAAVAAGVAEAPAGGYTATWFTFDNATGATAPIGAATTGSGPRIPAPGGLPGAAGAYVKVQVGATTPAHEAWATPVDAYFRSTAGGWKLVGLERLP
jgi:hypothetical protein